ncbi:DUF2806 domain-containing protein [Agrobacterium sp. FDAARGOS_525]|uniref:DUF2806 domain-containing protein n=1 Tax=Agrobacterium TaxID=357 RepID=UPI000F667457|nr:MULTISPECIES: DUF2806 domain-containing protein [Agrobacterium]MCZ7929549.1 DUF2806 domain-containing protein [Agrobacterium pusense]RSC31096.1 DUF2806 domain-containing protein [Agrobacterium sp. FDAARGOS_525]
MAENSDHLDKETSVSVAYTDNSIKAGAKSRFVAAIDRLGGSVVDSANAAIESYAEKRRAKTRGEVRLIEAITDYGVAQLGANPQTAERAFQRHFRKVISQQENIDHVLLEAKADLELNPPAADDPDQTQELSEEFMDRFEEYSSTATTEELRQRWGRVLASEVRKPGTFSGKVLRVIDEMDSNTAHLFEEACKARVDNLIIKCVSGSLPFFTTASFTSSGLMLEAGLGQSLAMKKIEAPDIGEMWGLATEWGLIGLSTNLALKNEFDDNACLRLESGTPRIPVYVLTDVGKAIASILPDNQSKVFERYAEILEAERVSDWIRRYKPNGKGGFSLVSETRF